MKSFFALFIFLLCILSCVRVSKNEIHSKATKGVLDLREWDFENRQGGIKKLDGEWEFYWNELLTSENFSCKDSKLNCRDSSKNVKVPDYIPVPHSWNGHQLENNSMILEGDGYATYRLTVIMPDYLIGEILALRSEYQGTAYRIYADSKLIQTAGLVGVVSDKAEAMHLPTVGLIQVTRNHLELIVQVSNYHNRLGGLWNPLYLGKSTQVLSLVNQIRGTELFVIGIIFIIGVYHLLIWLIRKKEFSPLLFSFLCITVLIRLITTSEYLFVEAFPDLGYKFYCVLEYGSMYFCAPVGIHYFALGIKNKFNRYIKYISYLVAIGFTVFASLTPVSVFSNSAEFYQFVLVFTILYLFYVLVYSVIKRIEYSILSLFGFLVLAVTVIQDILYSREIIHTGFFSPYALVVMIFSQAMILSLKFSKAFKKVEDLTESLELKVEERTRELNSSKEDIEALNNFTNIINSYSDLRQVFIEISKYVYQKYNIAAVWLYLPDAKEQYLETFKIYSHTKIPDNAYHYMENLQIPLNREGGISAIVWKRKEPFFAKNLAKLKFPIDREIKNATGSLSLLEVPLLMNKKAIGLMAFSNIESMMQLNKADIKKINVFCNQIAGVVNTVNLLFRTEKQKKEIEELNFLIKSLNEVVDIKTIMNKVHSYIKKNFNIEHFGLSTVSSDKQTLKIIDYSLPDFISLEEVKKVINTETRVQDVKGAHAMAFKSKKLIYSRIRYSILNEEELLLVKLIKAKSVLMLPLILQNEPIGFLDLYNVGELHLKREDITKISILGEHLAGIIHGSNLFKEVRESKHTADLAREQAELEKGIAMLAQKETERERQKSEKLLLNILPEEVAKELKEKGYTEPVLYDSVSVLFTDFKGFTQIAENMTPTELITELDGCFRQFDLLTERYNMEKLKTIGDSYMCVGGIPKCNKTNSVDAVLVALEIQAFMNEMNRIKKMQGHPYWELRVGIHTGPLVAGVIGQKKFAYDVWGDTVNTASRMESSGTPNRINISGSTFELIKEFFDCEYRGKVNAKNKGEVDMYYVLGIKDMLRVENEEIYSPNEEFWKMYWGL